MQAPAAAAAAEYWPSDRSQRSARGARPRRRPAAFVETVTPRLPGKCGSSDSLMPRPVFAAQTEPFCRHQATIRQLCFGEGRRDSGRVTHLPCLKNVSDVTDAETEIMTPLVVVALVEREDHTESGEAAHSIGRARGVAAPCWCNQHPASIRIYRNILIYNDKVSWHEGCLSCAPIGNLRP